MKGNFNIGLRLLGKMVIVSLLSFFICFSIQFICLTVFTEEVGYNAYGYAQGETEDDIKELYTHYYSDGEDTLSEEYKAKGYTVVNKTFRSELEGKGQAVFYTVSQIITFIMLIGFMSGPVWELGSKDANSVKFGRSKRDALRGFKIGVVANLLAIVMYFALIILKGNLLADMPVSLYALLNGYFFPVISVVAGKTTTASDLTLGAQAVLFSLLFVVPIITETAYLLGYKGVSIYEKIVYKNRNKG